MRYMIYSALIYSDIIVNITTNPAVDLTLLERAYNVSSLEILTPPLNISHAIYIMKSINKEYGILDKLILRGGKRLQGLKISLIKDALKSLGINPLRKNRVISSGIDVPGEHDIKLLHNILKGRIMGFAELYDIIKDNSLYFESSIDDIIQVMYLTGKLRIYPSIKLEHNRKLVCDTCEWAIDGEEADETPVCPVCGSHLDMDEPFFASPEDEANPSFTSVKFKDYRGFTPAQDKASYDLCSFLGSPKDECLLWTIHGSENMNITSRVIKNVLYKGGRCAVLVSCESEGANFLKIIKDTFPNRSSILSMKADMAINEDIVICTFNEIRSFYKAFDLLIVYMGGSSKIPYKQYMVAAKRSLKDWGKLIHSVSSPGYDIYRRALKSEVDLVAVPIGINETPFPEPRVITYRWLAGRNFFVPGDVVDLIAWSVKDGARVRIVTPSIEYVSFLKEELLKEGKISSQWILGNPIKIIITTPQCMFEGTGERENVIVFYADDSSVFDEKTLLDAAGITARAGTDAPGEVIFVGSCESDEMHNARMMLRFINKLAWEKGYLK